MSIIPLLSSVGKPRAGEHRAARPTRSSAASTGFSAREWKGKTSLLCVPRRHPPQLQVITSRTGGLMDEQGTILKGADHDDHRLDGWTRQRSGKQGRRSTWRTRRSWAQARLDVLSMEVGSGAVAIAEVSQASQEADQASADVEFSGHS